MTDASTEAMNEFDRIAELEAEIERLRVIEEAASNVASYFNLGGCGENDFDPQLMRDLMTNLSRALEQKP